MRALKTLWGLPLIVQYAVPIIGAGLVVILRSNMAVFAGQPFLLAGAVVALSALIGGLGPGLTGCVTTIALGVAYQVRNSQGAVTAASLVNWAAAAFVLTTVAVVIHFMRVLVFRYEESLVKLNAERAKLKFLLDSIQHGFLIVDRQWRLTFANRAVQLMSGRSDSELLGVSLWDITGEELGGLREAVEADRAAGQEVRQELRFKERIYDVRAIPHRDETLIYAQDLTERRRIESQKSALLGLEREARHRAESTAREKDDFLLTISHELRTPLTTILGWTEIVQSDLSAATAKRASEAIRRSARSQEHMVGQLLDLASINSGRLALTTEIFELSEAVDAAIKGVADDCVERGHILDSSASAMPLLIRGDQDQTSKALEIILDNALRYTPTPGRIRIGTSTEGSAAIVEIEDNGRGIEPEFLPHVFGRFRQSERTMTRSYNGLGLGLTIAKAIVDLHGGVIEASSAGGGQGTLIRVRLPLSAVSAVPTVRTSRKELSPFEGLSGLRILLVDDDAGTREVLSQLLQTEGATVAVATSGSDALQHALSEDFDLMVSDIGMPGMSGLELVERLRSDPQTSGLRALALSAYQDADVLQLCKEAGFNDFATKPIGRTELLSKIAEIHRQ